MILHCSLIVGTEERRAMSTFSLTSVAAVSSLSPITLQLFEHDLRVGPATARFPFNSYFNTTLAFDETC